MNRPHKLVTKPTTEQLAGLAVKIWAGEDPDAAVKMTFEEAVCMALELWDECEFALSSVEEVNE